MSDHTRSLEYLEHALTLAHQIIVIDGEARFSDLPVQRALEERWRRQAIYQMSLPMEGQSEDGSRQSYLASNL